MAACARLTVVPVPQHFGLNALAAIFSATRGRARVDKIRLALHEVARMVVVDETSNVVIMTIGHECTSREWAADVLSLPSMTA